VSELDKYARQIAVLKWRTEKNWEMLAGTPEWCDPKIAGWWLWGVCVQIGQLNGRGAWTVDPVSGRIVKWKDIQGNDELHKMGVVKNRPHLSNNGQGVNHPALREPGVLSDSLGNEFYSITMPELTRWFQWLSARLRHVRIVHGDWNRVCTKSVVMTLPVRLGKAMAGIFLDPPYSAGAKRNNSLYFVESQTIAHDVREWCKKWGDNPKYRIVLAGYDIEHVELESHGWRVYEWFKPGFLKGGMGKTKRTQSSSPGGQQHRERLWASPYCLIPSVDSKSD
jgi:hypothetical protein